MDTLVIGGGLAGLAATQRLVRAGYAVTLVEARDRLGGRVWTATDDILPAPIELGPEWIGGSGVVHDLLIRDHARLTQARGTHWQRVGKHWKPLHDLSGNADGLLERATARSPHDRSLHDALHQCCNEASANDARAKLLAYVEGFHAADPRRLSVQWLAEVEHNQPADASDLRSLDGVGRVVDALASAIDGRYTIRLNSVSREVHWEPGSVEVVLDSERLRAPAAIVTVPLPVLTGSPDAPHVLRFVPDLPEKHAAGRLLAMGHVVKLMLRFREPFWRNIAPIEDALFLHAFDQPFPTWWTPMHPEVPLLTAWAGGPQTLRLGDANGEELVDLAVASLAHLLGVPRREILQQFEAYYYHDWRADPFAGGAYTYVTVGGIDAHTSLAQPVAGTLFFAGEATCGAGFNATMEGAVASGWRAAEELLRETSR